MSQLLERPTLPSLETYSMWFIRLFQPSVCWVGRGGGTPTSLSASLQVTIKLYSCCHEPHIPTWPPLWVCLLLLWSAHLLCYLVVATLWAAGCWGAVAVSCAAPCGSVDPAEPQFCVQPARVCSFELLGIWEQAWGAGPSYRWSWVNVFTRVNLCIREKLWQRLSRSLHSLGIEERDYNLCKRWPHQMVLLNSCQLK